jgi:hypothetical protein
MAPETCRLAGNMSFRRAVATNQFVARPAVGRAERAQVKVSARRGIGNTKQQERGTKNSVRSEKQGQRVGDDRSGVPGDDFAGNATSYLVLAAANALLALPNALAPHTAADFLFGQAAQPHDFLHEPLLRLIATGAVGSAAVALALNLAAKRGELGEEPFKRLNLGLIALVTLSALLAASNAASAGPGAVLSFNGAAVSFLTLGLTIAIAWGGYGKSSEYGLSLKRVGPLPAVKKYQDDLADLPQQRGSANSVVYTLFTAILVGAGAGYLLAPEATLEAVFGNAKGQECVYLWRQIGGILVTLLPAVTYTLREGAQQGRLGESPFKALNLAMVGAGAGHLAVFLPILAAGTGGPLLPALTGVWGLTTLASGANLLKSSDE